MQIQNLASITQKYLKFPTALSSDLPHSDETHAFILYGTTLMHGTLKKIPLYF